MRSRSLILAFFLVALLALLAYLFWPAPTLKTEGPSDTRVEVEPTPVQVEATVVRRQTFILEASATGRLQPWKSAPLFPQQTGRILTRRVEEGQYLRKGEVLFTLEDTEQQIALLEAQAAWLKSIAEYAAELRFNEVVTNGDTTDLTAAREALERALTAFRAGKVSPEVLQEARRRVEALKVLTGQRRTEVRAVMTGLAQAEQQLERARLNLERTRVRAPFAGRVANLKAEAGQVVGPATELATLVDDTAMRVAVEVLESDYVWLREGRQARVQIPALQDTVLMGTLFALNPLVDPQRGTGRATVRLPNPDRRLRGGVFAFVYLETRRLPNRLIVPIEALLTRQGRDLVFVLKQGRAKWTYVTPGARTDHWVEIVEGLAEGDTVAVSGHFALAHDAPVEITRLR